MHRRRPSHPLHRSRWLAPVVVGTLLMASCGSDDDASSSGSGTIGAAPTPSGATSPSSAAGTSVVGATVDSDGATTTTGGGVTALDGAEVVVGAVLEPTSLDLITTAGAALDQVLLDNVYETLLRVDATGAYRPGLAQLPTVSADSTTYTFTIQDGVLFHDGAELTAGDVAWSLDTFRAADNTGAKDLASISSVEVVDPTTVKVTLTQPDNELLFNLTRRSGAVLEKDTTDIQDTANGTGPFTFDSWNVGSSISLVRNDDYWGTEPEIAAVTFDYFTDPNAAVNALQTGDVDILTGVSSDLIGPMQSDDDYTVNQGTTNGEFTLGFNNSRPSLSDIRVRRAIREAIDHQGILDLYNGFGTLIGGPVPPTDPWYEDLTGVVAYDPAAAKADLAAAGFGNGLDLTFVYPNIYPTSVAEYVVSQLADVGVTVDLKVVEFSVWLEQVYGNADYDLTAVIHVEPHDIGNYANPDYYWKYDNPEVQKLIGDAKVATSREEATRLLEQAARKISEDSPADWLVLYADLTVSTTNITGYPINDTASRFDAAGIVVSA